LATLPADNPERPGRQWEILDEVEEPRLIKSHLVRQLMPTAITKTGAKVRCCS